MVSAVMVSGSGKVSDSLVGLSDGELDADVLDESGASFVEFML